MMTSTLSDANNKQHVSCLWCFEPTVSVTHELMIRLFQRTCDSHKCFKNWTAGSRSFKWYLITHLLEAVFTASPGIVPWTLPYGWSFVPPIQLPPSFGAPVPQRRWTANETTNRKSVDKSTVFIGHWTSINPSPPESFLSWTCLNNWISNSHKHYDVSKR